MSTDFEAYAAARWPSLVRAAVFLGCSREDAQDLAQQTLLRCHVAWRRVQRADDPDAYTYRMLLNGLRDSRRRRWWGEVPTRQVPAPPAADRVEAVAVRDAVERALAGLSRDHREVVVLRYLLDLSERQAATVLGVPPGTVKSRLARALAQLAADPHLLDPTEGRMR